MMKITAKIGQIVLPTDKGYDAGYTDGYSDGHTAGESVGYESGEKAMREEMEALITRELTEFESDTLTYAGSSAFRDCEKLASVKLPNLRAVDYYAFRECDSLTEIDFPKLTDMVGAYPFVKNYALRRVNLPLLANLSQGAFDYCTALEEINCPNVEDTSEATYAFRETKLTRIDLPKASDVPQGMFEICGVLASVNMPTAKTVGEYAFNGCASLAAVDLSSAVSIGQQAFNGCTSLETLDLPSVESVDAYGMRGCTALSSVSLPKCKTIGEYAFQSCPKLQRADLSSAESIGAHAFQDIASLTDVVFPDNLPSVGEYAFFGCKVGGTLTFDAATAKNDITIGQSAFRYCSLSEISFNKSFSTAKKVTLNGYSFAFNASLKKAILYEIHRIPQACFQGCTSLERIDASACEYIDSYAFANCGALKALILRGNRVATLANTTAFANCPTNIYVPQSTLAGYKYDDMWSNFASRIFTIEAGVPN